MKVLISADMEGATGVTWTADVVPGSEQWQRMRRLLTGDVNACVAGLVAGGATEVLVNEAHSAQRNVLLEDLDERAVLLTGRHKPLSMMQGVDSGVDGVVFLGYHAGAGERGVLAHTYLENSITGVPVLLVTGDDAACADATGPGGHSPGAATAVVKEHVSRYAARCLPPAVTAALITDAATASMARAGRRGGVVAAHRVEVEFDATHLADAAAVVPTVSHVGVRRVGFDAASMTDAIQAFKIVTAIAASAIEGIYG